MVKALKRASFMANAARAVIAALIASTFVLLSPSVTPAQAAGDPGWDSEIDFASSLSNADETKILVPDNLSLSVPTGFYPFTVEMWVKPGVNMVGSSARVLTNMEHKYAIVSNAGKWAYYVGGVADGGPPGTAWQPIQTTTVGIEANRWVHLALVLTTTDTLFYVDGYLVQTRPGGRTDSGASTSVTFAAVGGWADTTIEGQRFDGQVDEIKIWQADRSASIATDMHSRQIGAAGLEHYWDFNEGSGTTIHDRVGNVDLTATSVVFSDVKQVTSAANGDTVVTFPRTYLPGVGGWKVPSGLSSAEVLAVAGGGAGGTRHGGGGAGEVAYGAAYTLTADSTVSIVVGMGGVGNPANTSPYGGRQGQTTSFGVTSLRGGGGGKLLYQQRHFDHDTHSKWCEPRGCLG